MRAGLLVVEHRQLVDRAGHGERQLAAGIGVTEQDVRERGAAFLAWIPALEDRVRLGRHFRDRQRRSVDQQHHDRLAEREHRISQFLLLADESDVGAIAQVIRCPGLAARRRVGSHDQNDRIGGAGHLACRVDAPKILAPVRQSHLVRVPIAAIGDADSLRGHELHPFAHLGANSVQDADLVRRHVRVAA